MSETVQVRLNSVAVSEIPRRGSDLRAKIERAVQFLPSQGPINVFVHHNTLHSLEDLPFDEALIKGREMYGCQPYLAESEYRQHLISGRIQIKDLEAALKDDLGGRGDETLVGQVSRFELYLAMLKHPIASGTDAELRWLIAETEALLKFRAEVADSEIHQIVGHTQQEVMRSFSHPVGERADGQPPAIAQLVEQMGRRSMNSWSESTWQSFCLQALWRACRQGSHQVPSRLHQVEPLPRPRDWLLAATNQDSDRLVDSVLIRFCAAFLDQGLAHRPLPGRERGFFQAFLELHHQGTWSPEPWRRRLSQIVRKLHQANVQPLDSIRESLNELGIEGSEEESFLTRSLLALRGWAGMIWQLETRGDRALRPAPADSLIEFLAVRLILDRAALEQIAAEELGYRGPLKGLKGSIKAPRETARVESRAFTLFQVAQLLGWRPLDLFRWHPEQWQQIVYEVDRFSAWERRRIFQQAYERHYYIEALDALSTHVQRHQTRSQTPRFQLMCCIDDREESLRRHMEEIAPDCQTFGAAGFFGVVMYHRGAAEAHFTPLCPIVVRPRHWIQEEAVYPLRSNHARRARTRKILGTASLRLHRGSRSFLGGMLLSILGATASIPLITRVIFPHLTSRMGRHLDRFVSPPQVTQLRLERDLTADDDEGVHFGYTVPEMADIVEGLLRDIGLTDGFARLFIALGHGSSSLNNPHESAYNCGACAGGRGGPNARVLARLANDPRVRYLLRERGITIPDTTYFVGGYHNTCDDGVTYYDLDRIPTSHIEDFQRVCSDIDRAREHNAHERCRRFDSAPLTISEEGALRHVETRAEDLAQSRPEYNHATNAICIVGRRELTRGLFLDRRAFLTSYDPRKDDRDRTILSRLLRAAIPVCAGISLEYYFSTVDPAGWGCGSKLPHNVTSMLGVMEGAESDLRTGLSAQMVEIHEPMRILFVIETEPATMEKIMAENQAIDRLVRNDWIRLATIDPETGQIQLFREGRFEPYTPQSTDLPMAQRSTDWYRGWRDHLGFARILKGTTASSSDREGQ